MPFSRLVGGFRKLPRRVRYVRHLPSFPDIARTIDRSKSVLRFLDFAQQCHERSDELAAEVFVAHGVEALPAADAAARAHGGRLVCDAVEIPSFDHRSGVYDWHPASKRFLDVGFESFLQRCDDVLTVSWSLRDRLPCKSEDVSVIPNYKYAAPSEQSTYLRERCGVGRDDVLLLSLSTVASGLETVLEALARLPANVHLAVVGRIVPAEYDKRVKAAAVRLNVADRVQWLDPLPYADLAAAISGADLGLIVLDPTIANNYVSLPNRLFDLIDAQVPVCTPDIPDIRRIVEGHSVGCVVPEMTADAWAAAIQSARPELAHMRAACAEARAHLTWESQEPALLDALGRPRRVAFFGVSDLAKNNRTARMSATLRQAQAEVTLCSATSFGPPSIVSYRPSP